MTAVTQLFVAATLLAAVLTLISIWAPRRLPIKGTALATSMLFLPLGYASLVDLLSKPKPVELEWWLREAAEDAEVLASRLVEGEGIYLWLQLPDVAEPRAYVLPWDRASAEQLQEAKREADQEGGGVQMRLPFEPSLEREARFYARPQPAPPPKDLADSPPRLYQPPGRDA
jgi:hypothetical protein